jgi:hypothetical protein
LAHQETHTRTRKNQVQFTAPAPVYPHTKSLIRDGPNYDARTKYTHKSLLQRGFKFGRPHQETHTQKITPVTDDPIYDGRTSNTHTRP